MARDFNGTTQTVTAPLTAITGTPLTLACWFNPPAAADAILMYVGSIGTHGDGWWLSTQATTGLRAVTVTNDFAASDFAQAGSGFFPAQWNHGCATFASATDRKAYVNGGSEGTNSTSVVPVFPVLGVQIAAGSSGVSSIAFFTGRIAEAGVWNAVLTPAEIASLAQGTSPLLIRPQNLKGYWPLIGRTSPEIELRSGASGTLVAAPATAAHCRVFYPASGYVPSLLAAPLPVTIEPPLISSPFTIFEPAIVSEGIIAPPVLDMPFTVYEPSVGTQSPVVQYDERELEPNNLKVRILDFVAGDDLRILRTYIELPEGVAISKGYLTIKRYAKDDTDAEAIVQKEITSALGSGGKITDATTTGGSIELYFDLTSADTATLIPLIPYNYDVQIISQTGAVYTCEKGVIVMQQGVTEATT